MRGPAYTTDELAYIQKLVTDTTLNHTERVDTFMKDAVCVPGRSEDAVSQKIRKATPGSRKRPSARISKGTKGNGNGAVEPTVEYRTGGVTISGPKGEVNQIITRL